MMPMSVPVTLPMIDKVPLPKTGGAFGPARPSGP
jgi:hypothetical protein